MVDLLFAAAADPAFDTGRGEKVFIGVAIGMTVILAIVFVLIIVMAHREEKRALQEQQ